MQSMSAILASAEKMTLYYVNISHIVLQIIIICLAIFFFLPFLSSSSSFHIYTLFTSLFYCIIYLCHITYVYNTILSASQPLVRTHACTCMHTHTHTHTYTIYIHIIITLRCFLLLSVPLLLSMSTVYIRSPHDVMYLSLLSPCLSHNFTKKKKKKTESYYFRMV